MPFEILPRRDLVVEIHVDLAEEVIDRCVFRIEGLGNARFIERHTESSGLEIGGPKVDVDLRASLALAGRRQLGNGSLDVRLGRQPGTAGRTPGKQQDTDGT